MLLECTQIDGDTVDLYYYEGQDLSREPVELKKVEIDLVTSVYYTEDIEKYGVFLSNYLRYRLVDREIMSSEQLDKLFEDIRECCKSCAKLGENTWRFFPCGCTSYFRPPQPEEMEGDRKICYNYSERIHYPSPRDSAKKKPRILSFLFRRR